MHPGWLLILPLVNWLSVVLVYALHFGLSYMCWVTHETTLSGYFRSSAVVLICIAPISVLVLWIMVLRLVRIECNRKDGDDRFLQLTTAAALLAFAICCTYIKPAELVALAMSTADTTHPIRC